MSGFELQRFDSSKLVQNQSVFAHFCAEVLKKLLGVSTTLAKLTTGPIQCFRVKIKVDKNRIEVLHCCQKIHTVCFSQAKLR